MGTGVSREIKPYIPVYSSHSLDFQASQFQLSSSLQCISLNPASFCPPFCLKLGRACDLYCNFSMSRFWTFYFCCSMLLILRIVSSAVFFTLRTFPQPFFFPTGDAPVNHSMLPLSCTLAGSSHQVTQPYLQYETYNTRLCGCECI